jgi:ATP-dependent Zn protease
MAGHGKRNRRGIKGAVFDTPFNAITGLERKAKQPTRPLTATAYHEAGHAVASRDLGLGVRRVTIKPNPKTGTGGICKAGSALKRRHNPESDDGDRNRMRMECDVVALLAGQEAEAHFRGRYNFGGARVDREGANDLLSYFVSPGRGPQEEFRTYFKLLRLRTRRLVLHRWPMIQEVAKRLLERETLSGDEVEQAIVESFDAELKEANEQFGPAKIDLRITMIPVIGQRGK